MKRIIALLLIVAFMFPFAACGGDTENGKAPKNIRESVAGKAEEAAQINNAEPTAEAATESTAAQNVPEEKQAEKKEAGIAETVLYDENNIRITAKEMRYDGWMGPELAVLIENNTEQNIIMQTRNTSVNGMMMDASCSANVAAGKKANETIMFSLSEMEAAGIETIAEIELVLYIINADSWDEIAKSDPIVLKTDADAFVQTFDDSGIPAYDENDIKIVTKKLDSDDSLWGADLLLYIENNSDMDVTIQVRDVSVNGFMVDPIFSCDVVRGKKALDTVSFMKDDLTENGITDIQSIELSFHIFDSESWDTILDTEMITITF